MKRAATVLVCAIAASGGSLLQRAAAVAPSLSNPLADSEQARIAGEKLYRRECAACHGADRREGAKAPPLFRREVSGADPGALFWILRNGSIRRGMPSFAHLPEPERWQIIAFLQSGTAYHGRSTP